MASLTLCDRCGSVIAEGRTLLRVESGDLVKLLPNRSTDLCRECAGALLVWLETKTPNSDRNSTAPERLYAPLSDRQPNTDGSPRERQEPQESSVRS